MRFFKKANSLVLLVDVYTPHGIEKLLAELDDLGARHTFSTLKAVKPRGQILLVFSVARRAVFQRVMPHLLERDIPYTLLVDTEMVGLNRLPVVDELSAYEKAYAAPGVRVQIQAIRERLNCDPIGAERATHQLRQTIGPLPLSKLDPMLFFANWKEIANHASEKLALAAVYDSLAHTASLGSLLDGIGSFGGSHPVAVMANRFCESDREVLVERSVTGLSLAREGVIGFVSGLELPYRKIYDVMELIPSEETPI